VYLANPDNPMGRWHEADEVVRFLQALPVDCIAILDEAYADFAPCTAIPAMDTADRRTIRTRTFSKAHGMAGARIGYALAQANLVVELEKVRNHFGVNRVAQAGALASLEDEIFVQDVVAAVAQGRADYARMAQDLGLATVPSATNFLCFDMGSNERAVATLQSLQEKGVFVRMPGAPPQNRCIRVTVGLPQERRRFEAILKEVLQA
jgi:histidinol-phosphate aminotransferase